MGFDAKILEGSISPDGMPLTTFEVTFPRIVLSEWNTHRAFSRNSASSRAIPVKEMIRRVHEDPYIPTHWGKNQKGMQAGAEVSPQDAERAKALWLQACDLAVTHATALSEVGIHKQLTNRLLEPFMWHTVIVTATEWSNFFHLRDNEMAHPDIQIIARMMRELYEKHEPKKLDYGQWHLPLIDTWTDETVCRTQRAGRTLEECREILRKISVARCARVSYLTHDGKRDIEADLALHDKLLSSGHMSPFEHVARPMTAQDFVDKKIPTYLVQATDTLWCGNLKGWVQYRKLIPGEADILAVKAS